NLFVADVVLGSRRAYVLRVRPGVIGVPNAGDFEVLAGMAHEKAGQVHYVGLMPSVETLGAKHFKLSADQCSRAKVSCAGAEFDVRLPLENSLSDDGDGVESSWRYYLAQAREAALESDARAKEFLDANLNDDPRDEELELRKRAQQEKAVQEMEAVQSTCGSAVVVTPLIGALGFLDPASQEIIY